VTDGRATCSIPRHSLLPLTQDVVLHELSPEDWLHVAEFLTGLLARRPLSNGENDPSGWRAERWLLGCLATELRQLALEQPLPLPFTPRTFGGDGTDRAIAEQDRRARLRGWAVFEG
jgi:hypothetical protein